MAIGLAGL